jgi:hypothetical protein
MNTKDIIIKSLAITDFDYGNIVMQNGYCWLQNNFGKDEQLINNIATVPLFWAWWKNQWEIRDREFIRISSIDAINEVLESETRTMAMSLYQDIHNPYLLNVQPNVWVKKEINHLILQEIAKEEELIKQLK